VSDRTQLICDNSVTPSGDGFVRIRSKALLMYPGSYCALDDGTEPQHEGLNLCVKERKPATHGIVRFGHFRLQVISSTASGYPAVTAQTADDPNDLSPLRRLEPGNIQCQERVPVPEDG
jgi:hypothetical protein